MRAILLAAGVGRRLGNDKPKALLEIGGRTLLERHMRNLASAGVPMTVVTGFEAEVLGAHLQNAKTIHNPEFRRGSVLSLRCALEGLDEDAVIMDADVLYDPTILADVLALERGFAIDTSVEPAEEEMMLGVQAGRVRAIRRGRLGGFDLVGEGVGFFKLDGASIPTLWDAVEASDPEGDYEAALDRFLGEYGADYVEVAGRPWTEIDFPEDVERAENEILPLLSRA